MITQKRTFLYQPSPLQSAIVWSWTFFLLFMGIVFWLEVTVIQWITIFFFLAFILFTLSQIMLRKITIENDVMTIGKVMNPRWIQVNLNQIKTVNFTKHRANIEVKGKTYQLLLPINSVIELNNLINSKRGI